MVCCFAVALAGAGWLVSLQLVQLSGGAAASRFLQLVCGGGAARPADDCRSVLNSPAAYVAISPRPEAPKLPVAALGLVYFGFVGLWYLFVGPPNWRGRAWHLLIAVPVLCGAWQSVVYVEIMRDELHRWCGGCLVVHAINGALVLLTLLAYPWRRPRPAADADPRAPEVDAAHPTPRLALATATAGGLAGVMQLAIVLLLIFGAILGERTKQYEAVLNDPEFVLWDFRRQPVTEIPLREGELFAGNPEAPHTVVVFGDFQCAHCRTLHERLVEVAGKYPAALRVAFRAYPQDSGCNPHPRFAAGGHASACRAARAAEAARIVGGREAYLAMRRRIWEGFDALPKVPFARQSARERALFADWAVELGLDRATFAAAFDSNEVTERIAADIELAERLGLSAMPVVYVDGRRLRNWSALGTWDAILGAPPTQP